jgi:hypothetical protein
MRKVPVSTWIVVALIVFCSAMLVSGLKRQDADSARLENQIRQNQKTIDLLCERGFILADVIQGGIAVVQGDLTDPTIPQSVRAADEAFLKRFQDDLDKVQLQTRSPSSLCYSPGETK